MTVPGGPRAAGTATRSTDLAHEPDVRVTGGAGAATDSEEQH